MVLQNPVHWWGDIILMLDAKRAGTGRGGGEESYRCCDVLDFFSSRAPPPQRRRRPSVETLHAVARLSSVPHLDLEETRHRVSHVGVPWTARRQIWSKSTHPRHGEICRGQGETKEGESQRETGAKRFLKLGGESLLHGLWKHPRQKLTFLSRNATQHNTGCFQSVHSQQLTGDDALPVRKLHLCNI